MFCSEDVFFYLVDMMVREFDGLLVLESCMFVSVSIEVKMKLRYLFMVFRWFDDNEWGYFVLFCMVEFFVVSWMVYDFFYLLFWRGNLYGSGFFII